MVNKFNRSQNEESFRLISFLLAIQFLSVVTRNYVGGNR